MMENENTNDLKDYGKRINQLVDEFESQIHAHLNEEYMKSTKWSDKFAPIIMMSQNRQSIRDKKEAVIDFAINYKAEQEIDDMQGHLNRFEDDFADFRKEVKDELAEIKKLLQGK
jgi:hypothetical protein